MRRAGWSLLLAAGCAPLAAPPQAAPPAPLSAPAAASSAAEGPPGPPTPLPVVAPANLLLEAKARPPRATARELGKALDMPVIELLSRLGPSALKEDAGLGAVVLAEGDESFSTLAAFSVPVTSEEAFARALGQAGWRKAGAGFKSESIGLYCKLADSLGDAPLRAICGPSERDANMTAPYLSRGLPQADLGDGDLRVRVRFAPAKSALDPDIAKKKQDLDAISPMLSMMTGVDPSLADAPATAINEAVQFIDAQEGLSLGALVDGEGRRVQLSGKWSFSGRSSWLVRVLTSKGDRAPVPATFSKLPAEASIALFGHGVDASLLEKPRRALRSMLGIVGVAGGQRPKEALLDLFDAFPQGNEPWALAAVDAETSLYLLGLEAEASALPAWLRKVGALAKTSASKIKIEASPAGFPKGSVLITWPPDFFDDQLEIFGPAPAKGRRPLMAAAAPGEASQSWLSLGVDREALKSALRRATGASDKDTLASVPGLSELRASKAPLGGMFSVRALIERSRHEGARKAARVAPDGFRTPVVFTGGVEPNAIEVRATIQQKSLLDLAALLGSLQL